MASSFTAGADLRRSTPLLERLEERRLLSASPDLLALAAANSSEAVVVEASNDAGAQQVTNGVNLLDISITDLAVVGDQLLATGLINGHAFTTLIDLNTTDDPAHEECPILNLSLGPISLDLLGLNVYLHDCDDGPVTVDITAHPSGGLLGDLLCAVANLLDGDTGLPDLGLLDPLDGLDGDNLLEQFTDALQNLLNTILGQATVATADNVTFGDTGTNPGQGQGRGRGPTHAPGQGQGRGAGRTDILNLEIGAIDLQLLGLQVETSDICLEIWAQGGRGNLLGNLIGGLAGLLDRGAGLDRIGQQLDRIADAIDRLLPGGDDVLTGTHATSAFA